MLRKRNLFTEVEIIGRKVDHVLHELGRVQHEMYVGFAAQEAAIDKRFADLKAFLTERFDQIVALLEPPLAKSIGITFSSQQGAIDMPLSAPANTKNEHAYIMGNDAADGSGNSGALLDAGQTITVVSADPNTVDFIPDSPAKQDNEGVQSVWSGMVVFKNPPAQLNTPVTVTATVTNGDGSTAETASDTITVTPAVAGVAKSIGTLFEQDLVSTA